MSLLFSHDATYIFDFGKEKSGTPTNFDESSLLLTGVVTRHCQQLNAPIKELLNFTSVWAVAITFA